MPCVFLFIHFVCLNKLLILCVVSLSCLIPFLLWINLFVLNYMPVIYGQFWQPMRQNIPYGPNKLSPKYFFNFYKHLKLQDLATG